MPFGIHYIRVHYIYLAPQEARKGILHSYIVKYGRTRAKCHQEINVAIRVLFFSGARAENPKLFGLVLSRDSVNLVALRMYLVKHAHFNAPQRRELYQIAAPVFKRGDKVPPCEHGQTSQRTCVYLTVTGQARAGFLHVAMPLPQLFMTMPLTLTVYFLSFCFGLAPSSAYTLNDPLKVPFFGV